MTKDHVIPKCLYPKSRRTSGVQLVTVPCCQVCNVSFTDDEPHFRSIMNVAGPINEPVRELWETTNRSFEKADGQRRVHDFLEQLHGIELDGKKRHMVYPGDDKRVMRIVRKVVRGLCYRCRLESPVRDDQVEASVLTPELWGGVPLDWYAELRQLQFEEDIFCCKFHAFTDSELHSVWFLTFFERTRFVAVVERSGSLPLFA